MNDSEIYTPKPEPKAEVKMVERKGDMTATAEKLYAVYDKARAIYRSLRAQNAIPEGVQVEMLEDVGAGVGVDASDTKKDE